MTYLLDRGRLLLKCASMVLFKSVAFGIHCWTQSTMEELPELLILASCPLMLIVAIKFRFQANFYEIITKKVINCNSSNSVWIVPLATGMFRKGWKYLWMEGKLCQGVSLIWSKCPIKFSIEWLDPMFAAWYWWNQLHSILGNLSIYPRRRNVFNNSRMYHPCTSKLMTDFGLFLQEFTFNWRLTPFAWTNRRLGCRPTPWTLNNGW